MKILPRVETLRKELGQCGQEISFRYDPVIPAEGYRIVADKEGILIRFSDEAGKFYAKKTLEQIEYGKEEIPCFEIEDAPKYSYRGFMADCCRHFFTVDELKKQIDVASALKLNRFHWHLTDDQGWRIEIKKYPRLTEIGSYRKQTRGDGKEVKGFYTQEEIKDIVAYCKERFIEVVPEFDMPGHFTSAIASYPHLGCTGEEIGVCEHFGIMENIACAGKESTYEFIYGVLEEICELFPFEFIHIGGDEALKYRYTECPDCQRAMEENGLVSEEDLQSLFMNKVIKYLNSVGKKAVVWNDGCNGLCGDFVIQYWRNCKKSAKEVARHIAEGKKIIYSSCRSFYLDYPYGTTSVEKTYSYKADEIVPEESIIGLEAPVWTEYVENISQWERKAYPRLFAVAERAWSKVEDYGGFISGEEKHEKFFRETYGIKICENSNPSFFAGLAENIAFLAKLIDVKHSRYAKLNIITNRRIKKKRKRAYRISLRGRD